MKFLETSFQSKKPLEADQFGVGGYVPFGYGGISAVEAVENEGKRICGF